MTSILSTSTWGSPTATKHALLIHGLTSSSHTWHRVASSLAARGYLVTAPNLIGHASRSSTAADADYSFDAVIQDLRPYLDARTYDLIVGHSWGASTALTLIPHLPPSHPTAIVLVDPPMRQAPEKLDMLDALISESCIHVKSADAHAAENPSWTQLDCIYRELGTRLCAVEAAHGVFGNRPWDFFGYLDAVPDTCKVTVLAADPASGSFPAVKLDDLKPYPHVRSVMVPGASHWIQYEFPDVIVEEALKRVAELDAV